MQPICLAACSYEKDIVISYEVAFLMSASRWSLTLGLATLVIVLTTAGAAQTSPRTYRIDSWKTGETLVEEHALQFDLGKVRGRPITAIVRDKSGLPRYQLKISFQQNNDRQTVYQAWNVELIELGKADAANLLTPFTSRHQDAYRPKDHVASIIYQSDALDRPLPVLSVPLTSRRIIKVESFYCVIEVHRAAFSANRRSVKSGTLSIRFTNTSPDDAEETLLRRNEDR
jgi:hypothetical protein